MNNNITKQRKFSKKLAKKILGIAVAIVMLFAVAGLAACELNNPTLAEYQATARADLANYANSRGQANFTTENWAVIQGHVTTGKEAIDAAETKPAVRTARDDAKAAVRSVPREVNEMGTFISLQSAFNNELITRANLLDIIYFHNGGQIFAYDDEPINHTPSAKDPATLSDEISLRIRTAWFAQRIEPLLDTFPFDAVPTLADVQIQSYFGTYNGVVAVRISELLGGGSEQNEYIDGIRFNQISPSALVLFVLVACSNDNGNGKIPDPGGKFCYETVIVQMAVAVSDGRTFAPADFLPEVVLSEVSVLMTPAPPTNRVMLLLTLETPSRGNVLRAVYALSGRGDVYRANLNVYETGGI